MPGYRLVIFLGILGILGILGSALGTYVHLTEKCFGTASRSYCTTYHPTHFKACLVRLDRKNLVMKVEDSSICFTGNSNGKCISNDVCINSETTATLAPPLPPTTTTTTTTTTRRTTTTPSTPIMPNNEDVLDPGLDAMDIDLSAEEWPTQHFKENQNLAEIHHESNPFSVLGLTTPIEVVLFGTLIALGTMLVLYLVLLGCQLSYVRTQKRTCDMLDVVLTKTLKHLTDLEQDMQERGLRVQPSSIVDNRSPAILPTLPAQNSFHPEGAMALSRSGSTGAIAKKSQIKPVQGTGGVFGSLTRAKPPKAPPAPPMAPRRSLRGSGYHRTLNSLTALDQCEEIELDETHV